jgi:hypothetical protein
MTDLDPTDPHEPGATPEARERAEQRTMLVPRRERDAHLAPGSALQEFVVEKVLGVGGYSIVYLAHDTRLDRRVAIKEYLPATLALRAPDGQVVPRLPRFEEAFAKGMASFINEARLLGGFDHPALVKVYRFWQANGTAYMAMPHYDGITLKKWLAELGAPPSEKWLRELVGPLTEALEVLHVHGIVHRDVAPDNVVMLYDRSFGNYLGQPPRPVLLDFGAARRVAAEASQQLTAILKTGYSPVEQYDQGHAMKAGPWSDIYSLSAMLFRHMARRHVAGGVFDVAGLVVEEEVGLELAQEAALGQAAQEHRLVDVDAASPSACGWRARAPARCARSPARCAAACPRRTGLALQPVQGLQQRLERAGRQRRGGAGSRSWRWKAAGRRAGRPLGLVGEQHRVAVEGDAHLVGWHRRRARCRGYTRAAGTPAASAERTSASLADRNRLRRQRPQVAPGRLAAREHAALDRQPVVLAERNTRMPDTGSLRDRITTSTRGGVRRR